MFKINKLLLIFIVFINYEFSINCAQKNLKKNKLQLTKNEENSNKKIKKEIPFITEQIEYVIQEADIDTLEKWLNQNTENINAINGNGETLLTLCFYAKYDLITQLVIYLINKGVQINAKNNDGDSILNKFAQCEDECDDIIKFLILLGCDTETTNKKGKTPFLNILENYNFEDENFEILKFIVEFGANINCVDNEKNDAFSILEKNQSLKKNNVIKNRIYKYLRLEFQRRDGIKKHLNSKNFFPDVLQQIVLDYLYKSE